MKKSKYLNKQFGDWTCTFVGVASVQPKFLAGTRKPRKSPGHQNYYYIFERITSDNKAEKMVRLNAAQVILVDRGIKTVEDYAVAKAKKSTASFKDKVSYHFISR